MSQERGARPAEIAAESGEGTPTAESGEAPVVSGVVVDPERAMVGGQFADAAEALVRQERSPARDVALARAFLAMERPDAAADLISALLDRAPATFRPAALWLKGAYLRRFTRWIDEGIEAAEQALVAIARRRLDLPAIEVAAQIEVARGLSAKRSFALAERRIEAALAIRPGSPRALSARGHCLLDADERTAAREVFEALLEAPDEGVRLGRIGLARLDLVMGDFTAAHAHLDAIGTPRGWLVPARLRGEILEAEHRFEEAARVFRAVAEEGGAFTESPFGLGVRALSDALAAAGSLARAGDLEGARALHEAIAEASPSDGWHHARALRWLRLDDHARESETSPKAVRLRAFPTVVQLRDHCGPASCELYLRYFGRDASQTAIAADIKEPEGGTPVHRMRGYLAARGLEAHRIEADLDQIKRLIDASIPVIMEEEYPSSAHVAVAVGYDDRQQVLEVQDPMSHRIRETPYEDLERLRRLSNHGALIAVPPDDAVWAERLATAGATPCRYIELVDAAWAALDDGRGEEGDALVDEAIGLCRAYELAWMYRFRRAREAAEGGEAAARVRLFQVLGEIEGLWPDDEWPQQYRGQALFADGRDDEALDAFRRARDRDPEDPYNWWMIALCERRLGDDEAAFEALRQALGRDPAYARASGYLADAARGKGRRELAAIENEVARAHEPEVSFHHGVHGELLEDAGRREEALAAYARAAAIDDPGWVLERRARLLADMGRIDEATALLQARIAVDDSVAWKIQLADLSLAQGRFDASLRAAKKVVAQDATIAAGHALWAAALGRKKGERAARRRFAKALALRPHYGWVHAERGKMLRAEGRLAESIEAFAAALGLARTPLHERLLGEALAAAGHPRDGLGHLRAAALAARPTDDDLFALAAQIAEHEPYALHGFFTDLAEKHPDDAGVLRAHIHGLTERLWAPSMAAPVLAALAEIAPEDPWALVHRGEQLVEESLETEREGLDLLREAARRSPKRHPLARRILATKLDDLGHHAEVVAVLRGTPRDYTRSWLTVRSLAARGKVAAAKKEIAAFARRHRASVAARLRLEHRLALTRRDYAAALLAAERLSHEMQERDDDGDLDTWEIERFVCLARLGERDRAKHLAEAQATTGASLGSLAWRAMGEHAMDLALELAERALELDPREAYAVGVQARAAELAGDDEAALASWDRAREMDGAWHSVPEQMARVLLGTDRDPGEALALVEEAMRLDHTCPWAIAIRAQCRLVVGDREGAAADIERAWGRADPRFRRECHDLWGLRAALRGKADKAERLWAAYGGGPDPVSDNDRRRLTRLRAAL